MKRVKIYALLNTLNNSVFYVGATTQKLNQRLSVHKSLLIATSKKSCLIYDILCAGGNVEIFELDECDFSEASGQEQFYMDLFRWYGFALLQSKKSNYNETNPHHRKRKYSVVGNGFTAHKD